MCLEEQRYYWLGNPELLETLVRFMSICPKKERKIYRVTPPEGRMTSSPNSKVREASGRVQHKAFSKHMEIFPHLLTPSNFIWSIEKALYRNKNTTSWSLTITSKHSNALHLNPPLLQQHKAPHPVPKQGWGNQFPAHKYSRPQVCRRPRHHSPTQLSQRKAPSYSER